MVPVAARAVIAVLRVVAPPVLILGGLGGTGYLIYQGVVLGLAWLKSQAWTLPVLYLVLGSTVVALVWHLLTSTRSTVSRYSSSTPVQTAQKTEYSDGRTIIIINNNQTLER